MRGAARGFTLVEVLVALLVMAVMATMAWQGVDGIVRAKSASEGQVDRVLRLNTVLAQWEQDLAAVEDTDVVPALTFDGSALRLTRRGEAGIQLVVWALHDGVLTRWLGPSVRSTRELQEAWLRSQQLSGNEAQQLRAQGGVLQWQVYFFRGNAWSNAQSSADVATNVRIPPPAGEADGTAGSAGGTPGTPGAAAPVTRALLPSGVRVVLAFAEGSGFAGTLTRDVRLGPQLQ
jgi:general secretion pathway protein J